MFVHQYLLNVGHVSFRSTSSQGKSKTRSLRSYSAFSRREDREGRRRTEPELYHSLANKEEGVRGGGREREEEEGR